MGPFAKISPNRPNFREGEKTTWVPEADISTDLSGLEHPSKTEEGNGYLTQQQTDPSPSQPFSTSIITELIGGLRKGMAMAFPVLKTEERQEQVMLSGNLQFIFSA